MYIKYRACVNINSFDVMKSLDFREFMRIISMLDSNELLNKFAKTYYSELMSRFMLYIKVIQKYKLFIHSTLRFCKIIIFLSKYILNNTSNRDIG